MRTLINPATKLSFKTAAYLYNCFCGQIPVSEFEIWLYEHEELEACLTTDDYLVLISLDFRVKYVMNDVERLLDPYIDWSAFAKRKLQHSLQTIINRYQGIQEALIYVYDEYCLGLGFLRELALGFGLTASLQFYENYLPEKYKLIEAEPDRLIEDMYPEVRLAAERVIGWLDSGKVKFDVADRWERSYIDHRTKDEKQLRVIQGIQSG